MNEHRGRAIAHGVWWGGLPLVAEMVGLGIVLALVLMAAVGEFGWFVLFLIGFVIPIAGGGLIATVWALTAGRVRYEAHGTRVVAFRGCRRMAEIDVTEFDRLRLESRLTWRNTLVKGSGMFPYGALDWLPRVVAERDVDRWDVHRVELPHVLVWGRAAGDEVDRRLRALPEARVD